MVRPRLRRRICCQPKARYFKPRGVPMRDMETIVLTAEELESLRLKNVQRMEQIEAAKKMGTSQSTFQRILMSAYQKISDAIVNGKALEIEE